MTEKRYKMVNTNLVDDDGLVYYLIKKDGRDVCQVFGKHTAKAIVTELNALHEENVKLRARNKYLATKIQRERNSHMKQHEKWEEEIQKENEQLKIKLEDIALEIENAKESNDDAQYELYKIKKENEQLKKGMIEVVDRYIRNVEHNPPSSARTYLKVKGALDNVREGLRDLLEDLNG